MHVPVNETDCTILRALCDEENAANNIKTATIAALTAM